MRMQGDALHLNQELSKEARRMHPAKSGTRDERRKSKQDKRTRKKAAERGFNKLYKHANVINSVRRRSVRVII